MRVLAAIVLAGAMSLIAPVVAFAAPAAGTVIGNQATATYNDAGGTSRTTTSNLVQTTVTQVKTFTLTANGARTAAPGQTVYYPHTITNTGNGTDTYTLNAPVSGSFGAGPHGSLAYYMDANGDGIPDNATPVNSSGPIAAGGLFRFVVAGTVPAGAVNGSTATITVSATDTTPTTLTNTDTTTVANAVVNVTKSFSSPAGPSPSGPITVTLSYTNTGTAAAVNAQFTDALNAAFTYVAGSGRWTVSGATALTDSADGVEQAGAFPPGIDYRSSLGAGATVVALIPSIPAGASGNVTFQVNVNANLAPQTLPNTAQYQTSTQLSTNTNTASYQVLQSAGVVANGSNTSSANGTGEPVVIAAAPAGSTFSFNNYVWNRGNGPDTFDMTVTSNNFPPGTTVSFLQQDGATTLINSGGAAAPDTGPIPGAGQACAAPFVSDATTTPATCGYRVVVRVTLPSNAPSGTYSIVKRATSVFNNAVFDEVTDTLSSVSANTVDVTNDRAAPPAGAAVAADGLAASGAAVVRTNNVTAGAAPVTTRFRVWVTNTGLVADTFNLAAVFAASNATGTAPPALPAGWSLALLADASGAPADCSAVGAPVASTGALAVGAARLVCAQVTVPPAASGTALGGNYDFDITATSATNAAVSDVIRDRVSIGVVRNIAFVPNGAQQTFPGGTVVYSHTLTNNGNGVDTASFAAGCLSDSRAAQGWTSSAFIDANANGTFEPATDTPLVCGVSSVALNVGETRSVFVRVTAPAGALATDPADVATLTATVAAAQQVTDSTTITTGLVVLKEQQALGTAGCAANNPPVASYSQSAIAAGPSTLPGACIAYRVTITNTTAAPITGVTAADPVPAGTRMHYACSGNGVSAPSTTVGAMAGTTPADNASGTVTANVGALAAGQSSVLYFCAQVNAATAPGSNVVNQATGAGTQAGNPTAVASNTTSATVGAPVGATLSALLAASTRVNGQPGATLFFRHTLTNTGTVADTYTVTATDTGGGWTFGGVALFPDANGDGQPDSATPLANPIALAPGQVAQFVLRVTVPVSGFNSNESRVRIDASSAGGAAIASIIDTVALPDPTPRDCAAAEKTISRLRGPSPNPLLNVRITYDPCKDARSKLFIADALPAGMRYIPGSGRWSVVGATPLTDGVVGDDRQGSAPQQITYDFNVTAPNTVTAWIYAIPANTLASISFNVEIDAGLAIGTAVTNTAEYTFFSAGGAYQGRQFTSTTYTVDGTVDLTLTGAHIPSAAPGTTVAFTNVLTNRGTSPDTFDVTLGASTFPAGVTLALFKPDGVTPLVDTDGDGTPDTGLLAPGASYNIVVKATLPESIPPGAYKVTKTARSALAPTRFVSADDVLDAVAQRCSVSLDPDNQALIGHGQHVTYTHFLTNRGNCQETVRAMLDYLGDSKAGWTSAAYIDNRVAGRGSLPGVVDATDVRVAQGWSQVLQPGESLRLLVDVHAPGSEAIKAARKQLADSNVTTLAIQSSVGPLVVKDTTLIDAEDVPGQPANAIRNFTDSGYATPTFWGVIGRDLFLRADAASCNADPAAIESRTVVLTGANGEREELTAVESGPNTGVFVVPALHVRAPPVVAGDGVVEGAPNDSFDFEILGCGRRIASVVTLMQPASVVFDTRSNDPIAGATVTLVAASGSRCSATPVSFTGASNPAVTGTDGVFSFPALAGDYCLAVKAPNGYRFPSQVSYTLLSPARNLNVTGLTTGGSYGNAFHSASGIVVDIPLDTAAQDGLFVQKEASKQVAELGDFVDYTVSIRNGTGNVLDRADVLLTDNLPAGFAYVKGTARRDGALLADPAGGAGPRLAFTIGHLDREAQPIITYRVRIGPGAMQGDGVNRAQATYSVAGTVTASNIAAVKVRVTGGVFTDHGFILGKVFLDCNANGVQDAGEVGVAGIRVVLEDGTYIITDGAGKFSFYGITNRTHVLKVDRASLPAGARLGITSARNLGDPSSRIVDLKSGELARADFALTGCTPALVDDVMARTKAARRTDELGALAGAQLLTEARILTDVKALPASGVVELAPGGATPGAATAVVPPTLGASGFNDLPPVKPPTRPSPAPRIAEGNVFSVAPPPVVALETLVAAFTDNQLDFVGLADGQTLAYAQANVRVKGAAGTTFRLDVNATQVPAARVGKRSVLAAKDVQAWEYVGVALQPGENTIAVTQLDSFGNARGTKSVRVIVPGELAKIAIELPSAGAIADGRTAVKVAVKLFDAKGVPVTVRTAVTLDASRGRWQADDLDPKEDGLQVFVENGVGEFLLMPPIEPGEARIVATSGALRENVRLDFLPELRNMIATGVIEGVLNMRNVNTRALVPARASDDFELELRHLSREWNSGKGEGGVRAAFYLKGKIKGEYLLTAAYDSDKDTQERLFRDIQPDEFYPIYGDSAVRGFDAQSTSKLYVRIDNKRSYLLWGDFTTSSNSDLRKLTNYSRSLTGVREHYENDRVAVNAFASRDSTRQVIEELRANGTSGPFQLGTQGALVNSEKVEIITRDRNQPAIILSSVPQARFSDYEIEVLTGRILFKSPVSSVDRDLNPVSIRVTYEVDQGGEQFWVVGVDGQVKVTDRVQIGGLYVKDKNPLAPFTLAGANFAVKLGASTFVIGEAARSESGIEEVRGDAARIEVKHESENLKAQAFVAKTQRGFENPGAYLTEGRGEAGGKLDYKLSDRISLKAEALRTEDVTSGAVRDGATLAIHYQIAQRLSLEVGLRHAAERSSGTSPIPQVAGEPAPQPMPGEVDTVRGRVSGEVPGVKGASVYGEVEVDVRDTDRKIIAVGGEYTLPNKGRVYGRHEFISSITGPYGLNQTERQNTTAVGIDTEYMKDGRAFSEYRIRDAMSGGDVEAALGLKNLWSIAPGLRLGTSLERVQALAGTGQNENTAVALNLEYTASPTWKGSTRLEVRKGHTQDSLLYTVGLAARINDEWTALARNAYNITRNEGAGDHVIERMQAGMAWRDSTSNRWNALARIENRLERDQSLPGVQLRTSTQIISLHGDFQLSRPFLVTGRYAAKWADDTSNGLATRSRAQALGVRATWEFAPKWDAGIVTSVLFGATAASKQYGVGVEIGYLVAQNLWISAGYNVFGYKDADMAGADYTARGPYIRLRYKFDEALLGATPEAVK